MNEPIEPKNMYDPYSFHPYSDPYHEEINEEDWLDDFFKSYQLIRDFYNNHEEVI